MRGWERPVKMFACHEKAFRCQAEKSFLFEVLTQPLHLMNPPKGPSLSHWRFFCLLKLLLQEPAPNAIEMHMLVVLNSNQGIHHIPWELQVIIRHNVWQWCSRSAIGSESTHPPTDSRKESLFFQEGRTTIHRLAFHHSQYSMHPFWPNPRLSPTLNEQQILATRQRP